MAPGETIMQKILHLIRYCFSFVPGGQWLARQAMILVGRRSMEKSRALLQAHGLKICQKIHDVLTDRGCKYFADHGTLLGLIRENGMIAHDTDMDFSIPPDQSLKAVVAALTQDGFSIVHGFSINGAVEEVTVGYEGLTMDFFKCHLIGDYLGHYVFVTKYDPKTGNYLGVMAHERKRPSLKGLETKMFGPDHDVQVSIPVNAIEYLTASYGNWQVPDSRTDFSSDKIPTQYRDINEGCSLLTADEIAERFL